MLCLLVYRLAEYRLRARLAETEQTIPDQMHKPTARPKMRWVFQCFKGIELVLVQTATTSLTIVLRLELVHRLILDCFAMRMICCFAVQRANEPAFSHEHIIFYLKQY